MKKIIILLAVLLIQQNVYSQFDDTSIKTPPYKLKRSYKRINFSQKPEIDLKINNGFIKIYSDKIVLLKDNGNTYVYNFDENNIAPFYLDDGLSLINLNYKGFPELLFYTHEGYSGGAHTCDITYTVIIDFDNEMVLWNYPCVYYCGRMYSQEIFVSGKKLIVKNDKDGGDAPPEVDPGIYEYRNGKFYRR